MEKINIKNTNEYLYYHKLNNGLELYVLPNTNQENYYITYSTKFGSVDTEFKTNNDTKYNIVPSGIAHYIEHLKFNLESGSVFDYYSKLGSSINAYTSYDVTCYEVFSSTNFKENFEYLLDYVETPYFTKELINSERDIIKEEINMYKNDPNTELAYKSLENVFVKDLRNKLISGDIEDIKKITLDDILTCYNTFYNPDNMFVIITGNVNPYEALAILEEKENKEYNNNEIIRKKIIEPIKVNKEYEEIEMNVETNKVCINLKIPKKNFKKLSLKDELLYLYIDTIFNILYGVTSDIQDKLINNSVINDGIIINKTYTKDYIVVSLSTDTDYPVMFINMVKDTLNNININNYELERKIKVLKSNYLKKIQESILVIKPFKK